MNAVDHSFEVTGDAAEGTTYIATATCNGGTSHMTTTRILQNRKTLVIVECQPFIDEQELPVYVHNRERRYLAIRGALAMNWQKMVCTFFA